jgi:phospholipid-translocating P-type ATPase (flippase)
VTINGEQQYEYATNFVKTSKYEVYNFLPKFLMESFNLKTKVANSYFLMVAALQCIPAISNTSGVPTTLLPLVIVLTFDGVFAALEDAARHRADKEANSSQTHRFNKVKQEFECVTWAAIEVGDFVRLKTRENIPADLIILAVAEPAPVPQGQSYVETKSLDGETNLKLRVAMPNTMGLITSPCGRDLKNIAGLINMEHPNKLIDSFTGALEVKGGETEAINEHNVLLRGCALRNTEWIIGVVANTGKDTKIMMSATDTMAKSSFLEGAATKEIVRIMLFLLFLAFLAATGMTIWNSSNGIADIPYLMWDPKPGPSWFVQFFYVLLLHATFIPVSLYVSMTIARFGQSYFMENDLEMYYEKTDTPMKCRTRTLNEELGQISHIFSDKTGTLTCNIMDFRKASIGGVSYGKGITEIGKASWKLQGREIPASVLEAEILASASSVPHVSFYCPDFEKLMTAEGNAADRERAKRFFKILSLCHDVIPEHVGNEVKLSASNPDDEALVCAAAYFGYSFTDTKEDRAVIQVGGHKGYMTKNMIVEKERSEEIEILEVIAFSSKRKRMTVILRDSDGQVKLMMKGAETTIIPCMARGQEDLLNVTMGHMNDYASEGLRCLLVGEAVLNEATFTEWRHRYKVACTSVVEIEKKKKGMKNAIEVLEDEIEKGLILVGCTAIEDKLQDGVPDCIAQLAKAGLNIWILTGDKEETAINIAVACNLVLPLEYMHHIICNAGNSPDRESMVQFFDTQLARAEADLRAASEDSPGKPRALIIDGPSLLIAMEPGCPVRQKILDFSKFCKVVVGCRVSPDQKREMVQLIKEGVPGVRTLSIGDGANDVAMIQEAHVGVGIKGEEGMQAVNASDFAIAQFSYLKVLLLKHGRYNYIRMSNLIIFNFYKNIFMSMGQYWFNCVNGFSGQKYYTEIGIQAFNTPLTFFPILMYAIYDMDIEPDNVYFFPQLYGACVRNEFFTVRAFWSVMAHGIVESCLCCLLPLYVMQGSDPDDGTLGSFWECGALCLTAVVVVVNIKMIFIQSRFRWIHFGVILASIASWFAFSSMVDEVEDFPVYNDLNYFGTWGNTLVSGSFWMTLILLVCITMSKDLVFDGFARCFKPTTWQIIQEIEIYDLPRDESNSRDKPNDVPCAIEMSPA